jgi:PleD family two-component response regulator
MLARWLHCRVIGFGEQVQISRSPITLPQNRVARRVFSVPGSGRKVALAQQKAGHEMPLRIMIVEDEEPLLELLRYNFECAGYAVDTLTDGNRVEASLEKGVPDILIVDWMLPGLSGIELCWRLRRGGPPPGSCRS